MKIYLASILAIAYSSFSGVEARNKLRGDTFKVEGQEARKVREY